MKRRLRLRPVVVALHTTYKYRRNCLVMVDNATAADPEFVSVEYSANQNAITETRQCPRPSYVDD